MAANGPRFFRVKQNTRITRMSLTVVGLLVFFTGVTKLGAQTEDQPPQKFSPEAIEFFEAKIRPVLIVHCYECHNSRDDAEGELALDYRGGIIEGGDSGPAVDFVNPAQSYLLQLVRHEVPGSEMPSGRPKLPDTVIADLQRWIEMGLPDPRSEPPSGEELESEISWPSVMQRRLQAWCYQPIKRPAVPESGSGNLPPVDAFIRQRLAEQGLEPSATAPAQQLVRRLYFTLIGLPPTADQAQLWTQRLSVTDRAERDANYAALVDELLASPHFGERWARHWMDWLRYAESHGSEGDPLIENAWHYRDYLIRAINDNVPYDQLVREHLAGDLLAEPRVNHELGIVESLIGTAHWRMVFHGFTPTDALDERVRFIDDQINVFSKAFMGMTVSCARCHDHKFDAIGQDDYYALFGVLGSNRASRHPINHWPDLSEWLELLESLREPVRQSLATEWLGDGDGIKNRIQATMDGDAVADSQVAALLARLGQALKSGESIETAWRSEEASWREASAATASEDAQQVKNDRTGHWNLANPEHYAEWYADGPGLPPQTASAGELAIASDGDRALVGIYPSGVYSHRISDKLPARLTSPDIQLKDEYEIWIEAIGAGDASLRYVVQDYPRDGTVYPIIRLNDGQWKWHRLDVSYWNGDQIHIELSHARDAPLMVSSRDRSWFGVRQVKLVRKGTWRPHEVDESLGLLFELTTNKVPHGAESVALLVQQAILQSIDAWKHDRCDDRQAQLLNEALRRGWLENRLSQLPQTAKLVNEYRSLEGAIPVASRVPGLREARVVDQPLYLRGDHRQPAEPVARRFPALLSGEEYPQDRSGRMELAEDLLRADNPLTRRVIVNRLWHHVFGRGIVATPDNFGLLGAEPTHPELLDWLADSFSNEHGWSLKSFIREMVLSESWQQDSRPSSQARSADPDNRYWSHALAGRLEAETIRDQMLAVAQTLDRQMFGPPQSNSSRRRSIYLPVMRNSLDPFLRVFDFPEPFSSVGSRDATNVPAQSLALLNDPLVVESAEAMARRLTESSELSTDSARIERLFWLCFGREPNETEQGALKAFLNEARDVQAAKAVRVAELQKQQHENDVALQTLLGKIRQRLSHSDGAEGGLGDLEVATPLLAWEFDQDSGAARSDRGLELHGGARIEGGRLAVRDGGFALSVPLNREITEKTLEAWVALDNLDQRGGGVVALQTADGTVFDSIVFGEQSPGLWLAGSEFFNRTQGVAGPREMAVGEEVVHLAITYQSDGEIALYRNGEAYGQPYRTSGPFRFSPGSVVTLGLRHLPAGGNRGLNGHIVRARLYERALSPIEVAASYRTGAAAVSLWGLMDQMTEAEKQTWQASIETRESLAREFDTLGSTVADPEVEAWQQLIHGLFMTQEFIYVR